MPKPKILVIDDDEPIRTQMKWALVQDYEVLLSRVVGANRFFTTAIEQLNAWAQRTDTPMVSQAGADAAAPATRTS